MGNLVEYIRPLINPKEYYTKMYPEVEWPGVSEGRVICPFHNDVKTPSMSLNPDNGSWYCHGCRLGGSSIVSFHGKILGVGIRLAAEALFDQWVHPVIDDKTVRKAARALKETPSAWEYVRRQRLISEPVVKRCRLGFSGRRFVIPVFNEFELCVNTRLHDPLAKRHDAAKVISAKPRLDPGKKEPRSFGSPPMLYPIWAMFESQVTDEDGWIFVCEGEWDALALLSIGLYAVTTTGGANSWPSRYNEMFLNRRVAILADKNPAGELYKRRVIRNLKKYALVIVEVPVGGGERVVDVTDWLRSDREVRRKGLFISLAEKAAKAPIITNTPSQVEANVTTLVPLDRASEAEWYNRKIAVNALVTGKDTAPYLLAKRYRASCNQSCEDCPLLEKNGTREIKVNPKDSRALSLIDVPEPTVKKTLAQWAGLANAKPGCCVQIETIEAYNIEQLLVIPTLDMTSNASTQYVMRSGYFIGHGLQPNRSYRLEGTTIMHPQDQHSTHLFSKATPMQDEVDTFTLTPELRKALKVFQVRGGAKAKARTVMAHLVAIADWQSNHVTQIRQRPDVHIAVDLAFHSPAAFDFNREQVKRGMLDILVIGDTRCGKGFITEGLSRYYGLGEVASGENCSFAGLIGGIDDVGRRRIVKWGIIPLNHGRAVIIDEASSLQEREIGHLSRVRSEGVAEITKIIRETTRASVRLIWLSNPRDGRAMAKRNYGVEAVKELVGANEDVSRFDFAISVATDEVDSELINDVHDVVQPREGDDQYPREICRALVLWAWSRRPEQIHFSPDATALIIREAIEFGRVYSAVIPLVQAENIRIKIAKISASVAARVFSTDSSGDSLQIEKCHVECACEFLRQIYAKPSMAYDRFSAAAIASSTIKSTSPIDKLFASTFSQNGDRLEVIRGLIELHRINSDNLADYVGDLLTAKSLVGDLVKLHCLQRIEGNSRLSSGYLKNPAFTRWLRTQNRKGNHETVS